MKYLKAKYQLGGNEIPLVKAESKEIYKSPNGKIMKVNENAPSHDDNVLVDGSKVSSTKYNEGGLIIPAQSVLSATHENRDSSDKSYTELDEQIKVKPQELKEFAKMLGIESVNTKQSVSPSKAFELLRDSKLKKAEKLLKHQPNEFDSDYSKESFKANLAQANSLISDSDLYDFMFSIQESKKNYLNVRKAQLGINTGLTFVNRKNNDNTY